jgi:hypothetical protein
MLHGQTRPPAGSLGLEHVVKLVVLAPHFVGKCVPGSFQILLVHAALAFLLKVIDCPLTEGISAPGCPFPGFYINNLIFTYFNQSGIIGPGSIEQFGCR